MAQYPNIRLYRVGRAEADTDAIEVMNSSSVKNSALPDRPCYSMRAATPIQRLLARTPHACTGTCAVPLVARVHPRHTA
jgi:hypothetical protein